MPGSLSVCSIVKNEEPVIARMLESIISLAGEIIIADTGSTDRTAEIAESYGARVFNYQWNDNFAAARNFAASQATKDWIFFIDADEVLVNPGNVKKYLDPVSDTIYMFKIRHLSSSTDLDNAVCHSTGRLFPRNRGFGFFGSIHEHLVQAGNIAISRKLINDAVIIHYGYSEAGENISRKYERNIRLLKDEIAISQADKYYYYLYFLLGKEYIGLKDYRQAELCFYRCLAMPEIEENILINTVTHLLKIFALRSQWNKIAEFCKKYAYAAYKNPDFCFIYGNYLGEVRKKYSEADFYYSKALEFNPENYPYLIYDQGSITWKPLLFLGVNSLRRNDWQSAAGYLEKAFDITGNIWQVQYNLVTVYLKLGKKEEAEILLKNSAALLPDGPYKELEKQIYG
jgi:glycosyltransferase involved in cell wall biosynthesis